MMSRAHRLVDLILPIGYGSSLLPQLKLSIRTCQRVTNQQKSLNIGMHELITANATVVRPPGSKNKVKRGHLSVGTSGPHSASLDTESPYTSPCSCRSETRTISFISGAHTSRTCIPGLSYSASTYGGSEPVVPHTCASNTGRARGIRMVCARTYGTITGNHTRPVPIYNSTHRRYKLTQQCRRHPVLTHSKRTQDISTLAAGFASLPMGVKGLIIFVGTPLILVVYKAVMTVVFQNKLIYMPYLPPGSRTHIQDPNTHGLGNVFSEHRFTTPDGVELQAWLFQQPNEASTGGLSRHRITETPVVLYFHGNAGNLGDRIYHIKRLYKESQCHIFVLSYRGYGHSGGRASGKGLAIDAEAALSFIQNNAHRLLKSDRTSAIKLPAEVSSAHHPVVVYGHSIGGAVGIHLAAKDTSGTIVGLVVENTFTSLGDVVKFWYPKYTPYPFLTRFIWWPWHSEQQVANVDCPILFISGEKDEMIPSFMMHRLHAGAEATNNSCTLVNIPNGLHNDTWTRSGYWPAIRDFFSEKIGV